MATVKITDLTAYTDPLPTDVLPIVDVTSDMTKNVTIADLTKNLDVNNSKIRVRNPGTPASSSDAGDQGEIRWDSNYIYVCISSGVWKRAALSTW